MSQIADLRREYTRSGLDEKTLLADPIAQFESWLAQARDAGLYDPNAMTLATSSADGPNARVVLLKDVSAEGFVFYTNYESEKSRELADDARATLVFLWHDLERQVRVRGNVERVPAQMSAAYFATRPRGAQLGAWASDQSRPVESRAALEERLSAMEKRFENKDIPCPPHWGGFRLRHQSIEFWQGRPNRLHDRIVYRRSASKRWTMERLCP